MKLDRESLRDRSAWEKAGYLLPAFDPEEIVKNTLERPVWVHMGAGNLFRAFLARVWQSLLDQKLADTGIVAVEGFDPEIVTRIYQPHGDICVGVTLKNNGSLEKQVLASVGRSAVLDPDESADWHFLRRAFVSDSLQLVSFTITEKGYQPAGPMGVASVPKGYLGRVTSLLYERWRAGGKPLALVSMDNCSHNGEKLEAAVTACARAWVADGSAQPGFLDYLRDRVSFPWTMIDKITPRPGDEVLALLEQDGLEGMAPVITARNTYIAPYVNAEEAEYLVIEDDFPAGRPPLELGGLRFTDRQTVERAERMKVGACLNPIHTALAVFGCLLGYTRMNEEAKDPALMRLARRLGFAEGLPAVDDPGILDPGAFLTEFLERRLPNPFLPDSPQRIATDTSQKLAVRFGETVKTYLAREDLDPGKLKAIPLVFAGWCRYLVGLDDEGRAMQLSPDPLLGTLLPRFQGLALGETQNPRELLGPLLRNETIFGVDLYQAGLGEQVEADFSRMMAGPGAVREVLSRIGPVGE